MMKPKLYVMLSMLFVVFPCLSISQPDNLPQLVDVTQKAGIDFVHNMGDDEMSNIIEATGAGCAAFDYDGDGDMDIYLVNGCYIRGLSHVKGRDKEGKLTNKLYRNNGDGTFSDVTKMAGVGDKGFGMGCVAGDIDNDGDADLFVTNYGPNVFYRNNSDGTFSNATKETGLENNLWGIGASFFDYDCDGFLDLYVGNYLTYDPDYKYFYAAEQFPGPLAYQGQQDILYHNRGDGTFDDVTEKAGVLNPDGRAMSVGTCDIDNDGDMDIFVANDAMENYLYRNNGDGTFTDIALESATGFGQNGEATSAMGPGFGDFNLDGFMDIMVPDMGYSCIYRNTGQDYFEEMSAQMGVAVSCGQYTSWSGNFFDFDNDGLLDMFIANGDSHELDPEEDLLFWNDNGKRFIDVSSQVGSSFQDKFVSRGSSVFDFDDDGAVDILVLNINNRARLLKNQGNANHWLKVRTIGTKSNRDGIGARIRLTAGGKTQTVDIVSSSGYLSQSDIRAHFGLGNLGAAERIEIDWPSGKKQILENVKAGQVLTVTEPE